MNSARFLTILNRALDDTGLDPLAPYPAESAASVAAWAGFLRRCVAAGVSLSDPRWRQLEVQRDRGRQRLSLHGDGEPDAGGPGDFTLGLSLLMSMLGDRDDTDSA